MNQTSTRPEPDAVKRALEVLGDRWTFLILREAFFGVRRYGHFQRNLGIGRNVLAARLSALVEHGLLERVRYRTDPDWYEYRLTQAGLDLFPSIATIKTWADQHLLDCEDSRLHIRHRPCGAELTPVVVCGNCREAISATDVEFDAG
ncbi:MAG TPA: helix-turn-helix domain-containing protein [Solirubrobacteraceae bacterium]|nr:helix-turn-helix domain-containing protein [Solirubrobacteraceae bacterium]